MSPYVLAIVIAGLALLALALIVARAVHLTRRFAALAGAYRRQLAAESAMIEHRRAELLAELARRKGRARRGTPRTMR